MPYFVPRGSQGTIEIYKTEKCRTCDVRSVECPIRGFVFTNRGIKPKIMGCDRWVERPKKKGARREI